MPSKQLHGWISRMRTTSINLHAWGPSRRAFTLIEALLASSILFAIVTAVTGSVVAGQQHAYEAQQRISAMFAAEALLGQIVVLETSAEINAWDGYVEAVGAMVDESGLAMPDMFGGLGRRVIVSTDVIVLTKPNVNVQGQTIAVEVYDATDRVLVRLERFVAEQQP